MHDLKRPTFLSSEPTCPVDDAWSRMLRYGASHRAEGLALPRRCRVGLWFLPAPHTLPTTIAGAKAGVSEA